MEGPEHNAGNLTDRELLDQAIETPAAVAVLYERYMAMIFGVCMKYLKDPVDSEDAAMEIYGVLTEKIPGQDIREFKPWLFVLTRNHCLQILRKRQRSMKNQEEYFMHSVEHDHPVIDMDQAPDRDQHLRACLGALNIKQRQAIELFYFESRTYDEIATELGTATGLVRSYIQNGRRNLKICMERKNGKR